MAIAGLQLVFCSRENLMKLQKIDKLTVIND